MLDGAQISLIQERVIFCDRAENGRAWLSQNNFGVAGSYGLGQNSGSELSNGRPMRAMHPLWRLR